MEVQLRESFLEIPTRSLLAASANPAVFGGDFRPFPYSMLDRAADEPAPEQWRTVELENEYLLLIVLPDMGGRVARLYDKIAGRDVFVPVSAALPEWIGCRGLQAAGGLEFDFPASPSPTAADCVNCLTRRYPDGSASVVIGAIERLTFMNWKVELRLYPELAYVEQSVELVNPTDNFHPFSCWSSASVPFEPGMRACCPFDWRATENGLRKWPMDGLIDSSRPAELQGFHEISGRLAMRDFFGVYYPSWDYGVAHSAPRKRAKGARILLFDGDEMARERSRALFGKGEECAQMLSGPFEPGVSRQMRPHQVLSWKEYWFGVRGIGPFAQASREAAAAVERFPGGVVLRFSPNGAHEGCTVRLTLGGQAQECRVSLYPESPAAVEFGGVGAGESLAVDVFCRGRLLLSLGHGAGPVDTMPDPSLFEDSWIGCPGCEHKGRPPSKASAGRALLSQRKAGEAAECFTQALCGANSDGEERFGLAASMSLSGDAEQARRLYYDIAQDSPLFKASALEAAALNIRLGDPFDNVALLEECEHPWGKFLLAVSLRLTGCADAGAGDPGSLDEFFLAEQYLSGGGGASLTAFTGSRENQLACIASVYAGLGLGEDCLAILSLASDAGMKTALFKALFGRMKLSDALSLPLAGVFVNEPPLLGLLESCEDGAGKAAWLLGCFRYSAGLAEEALQNWLEAYAKGLRHTALLFSLGEAHALRGETEEALRYLREDAALHLSENPESLVLLSRLLKKRGDAQGRLELLPLLRQSANRPMVSEEIAGALLEGGFPEEAIRHMEEAPFWFRGGGGAAGPLWSAAVGALALRRAREGRIEEARAVAARMFAYPENLRYGLGKGQSRAGHLYVLGQVYRLTGDAEKSLEAFREGACEGGIPTIAADAAAMRWVNLCQDALRDI